MRHAQEHWLRMQARQAVALAMEAPDALAEWAAEEAEELLGACPAGPDARALAEHYRQCVLSEAAKQLVLAELLARRGARGGTQ